MRKRVVIIGCDDVEAIRQLLQRNGWLTVMRPTSMGISPTEIKLQRIPHLQRGGLNRYPGKKRKHRT